jgi:pimeloyl-ACP methyl ester carboxylesterase
VGLGAADTADGPVDGGERRGTASPGFRHDALVPPENGRVIAGRVPGAELVVIPNANHVLMTDQPEHVSKVLVDWLARNR